MSILVKGRKVSKTLFILTPTGKIIITPARKSIVRMRRKLKNLKIF